MCLNNAFMRCRCRCNIVSQDLRLERFPRNRACDRRKTALLWTMDRRRCRKMLIAMHWHFSRVFVCLHRWQLLFRTARHLAKQCNPERLRTGKQQDCGRDEFASHYFIRVRALFRLWLRSLLAPPPNKKSRITRKPLFLRSIVLSSFIFDSW